MNCVIGCQIIPEGTILSLIVAFYEKYIRQRPGDLSCPKVSPEDNLMLQGPFEPQEILASTKACARDKAPGPDGFSMTYSYTAGR